jgi:hypothetical protein
VGGPPPCKNSFTCLLEFKLQAERAAVTADAEAEDAVADALVQVAAAKARAAAARATQLANAASLAAMNALATRNARNLPPSMPAKISTPDWAHFGMDVKLVSFSEKSSI